MPQGSAKFVGIFFIYNYTRQVSTLLLVTLAQAACVRHACAMRSLAIVITNFRSFALQGISRA